jgi:hypothetical protein
MITPVAKRLCGRRDPMFANVDAPPRLHNIHGSWWSHCIRPLRPWIWSRNHDALIRSPRPSLFHNALLRHTAFPSIRVDSISICHSATSHLSRFFLCSLLLIVIPLSASIADSSIHHSLWNVITDDSPRLLFTTAINPLDPSPTHTSLPGGATLDPSVSHLRYHPITATPSDQQLALSIPHLTGDDPLHTMYLLWSSMSIHNIDSIQSWRMGLSHSNITSNLIPTIPTAVQLDSHSSASYTHFLSIATTHSYSSQDKRIYTLAYLWTKESAPNPVPAIIAYDTDQYESIAPWHADVLHTVAIAQNHTVIGADMTVTNHNNSTQIHLILNVVESLPFQTEPIGYLKYYVFDTMTSTATDSLLERYDVNNERAAYVVGVPSISRGRAEILYMTWPRLWPVDGSIGRMTYDIAVIRRNITTGIIESVAPEWTSSETGQCVTRESDADDQPLGPIITPRIHTRPSEHGEEHIALFWGGCHETVERDPQEADAADVNPVYVSWYAEGTGLWSEPFAITNDNRVLRRGKPVSALTPAGSAFVASWEVSRAEADDTIQSQIVGLEVDVAGRVMRRSVLGPTYTYGMSEDRVPLLRLSASEIARDGEFGVVAWSGWQDGEQRIGVSRFRLSSGPVARDDYISITTGDVVDISVTQNDSHTNNNPLVIVDIQVEGAIAAYVRATQELRIDATASGTGRNMVTYRVKDASGRFDSARLVVDVKPQEPMAGEEEYEEEVYVVAMRGRWTTINVLQEREGWGGERIRMIAVTQPEHGETVINANQTIGYRSDMGPANVDSFGYEVESENGQRWSGRIYVEIKEEYVREVEDIEIEAYPGESVVINVFEGEMHERIAAPRVVHLMGPKTGVAWVRTDQMIVYRAEAEVIKEDIMVYHAKISDDESITGRIVIRGQENVGVGARWSDGTWWTDGTGWWD